MRLNAIKCQRCARTAAFTRDDNAQIVVRFASTVFIGVATTIFSQHIPNIFQMKFMNHLWSLLAMICLLWGFASAATAPPFSGGQNGDQNGHVVRFPTRCPQGYVVVNDRCREVADK